MSRDSLIAPISKINTLNYGRLTCIVALARVQFSISGRGARSPRIAELLDRGNPWTVKQSVYIVN